jgi:N utilization substance protein A
LEQANLHAPEGEEYEAGEEFIEEITLDNLADNFGRRLIALASQNLNQKIRDIEKDQIYNEYVNKIGDIIIGEIYQVRRNDILVLHNKVEVRMPRDEQIHGESYRYKKNQTIKAVIKDVRRSSHGGHPDIIISRASKEYLSRLFEVEIPEIYDGIIQIKAIEREAGERSKVAVMSFDDRVDPVGACVGMKGIRIHSIVRELNNENIDLIEWSDNDAEYIRRALSPAKIKDVQIDEETRTASIVVPDDQVSFAIGKSGQNVRLASKLTGYNITLIKEGGEDIDLDEFKVEFGEDLYEELVSMRIETAREFLETPPEELLEIDGMSKELLLELRQIILIEFDEKETKAMKDRIENAEIGYIKDDVPSEKPEENSDETEDEVVENETEEEKSSTEE